MSTVMAAAVIRMKLLLLFFKSEVQEPGEEKRSHSIFTSPLHQVKLHRMKQ